MIYSYENQASYVSLYIQHHQLKFYRRNQSYFKACFFFKQYNKEAIVVFPFVPVIPTNFNFSDGLPK
jgi:hypothetical protein